ncbi:MAG TPA: hypothetical protein VNH18_09545, partial [Bryobacteraceae bacterium]|nr:hypothetical protein [Bryobacteraceae bacterium]
MSTEAQVNANKANSQKSTGPRTEPGKNRARFNALRHGLTGHIFALLPADMVAFAEHEKGFMESLKPVGHAEKTLVTQIARDHWRINGHSANEQNIMAWV